MRCCRVCSIGVVVTPVTSGGVVGVFFTVRCTYKIKYVPEFFWQTELCTHATHTALRGN